MSATTIGLALELAIQLLGQSQRISQLVATAQGEGRTELKPEEWDAILGDADTSRTALVEAIDRAKSEGR